MFSKYLRPRSKVTHIELKIHSYELIQNTVTQKTNTYIPKFWLFIFLLKTPSVTYCFKNATYTTERAKCNKNQYGYLSMT
jgi:hypothetical protein